MLTTLRGLIFAWIYFRKWRYPKFDAKIHEIVKINPRKALYSFQNKCLYFVNFIFFSETVKVSMQ